MKKVLLFFVYLISLQLLVANQVDTLTAKQVALHFYNSKTAASIQKNLQEFVLVYPSTSQQKSVNQEALVYIYNAGDAGFVIVAADNRVRPILGYSTEGAYNPNHIPPAFMSWIQSYEDEIQYAIDNEISATSSTTQAWQALLSGTLFRQKGTTASGSPMITTKWGQGNRYNSQCPFDVNLNTHCVTGCVVVAMAQVMNYWKHPHKGFGAHTYVDHPFGLLSADFENTIYRFDSMPNALSSYTPANQIYAVAVLMYHCGVSMEMDYGVYGSNASLAEYVPGSPSAELALKSFFGYPDIIGLHRSQHSDSLWIQILKNEIDSARPVLYRASGDVGGHAFVLDAYDDSNYFHINWGWTGYADGYFSVSALNPASYSFPNGHYILINIKPSDYIINPDSNHIVYISPTGAGKKDGSSWSNASPHLAFAMQRKYTNPTQIWVKEGMYFGDTNNKTAFRLAESNTIFGSFAGNESSTFNLSMRNLSQHPTILDGQNKHRVLSTAGATDTNRSLCDGFIIQNGFCNEGGAGIYMNGGKLQNCVIQYNISDSGYGGGVYVNGNARLTNCNIHHNKALFGGGAIIWDTTYLVNCNFISNMAVSNGGGIYNGDTCFVRNCIFWDNTRNAYFNQIASNSSAVTDVSYSAIQSNYSGTSNINLDVDNDGSDTNYAYVKFTDPDNYDYSLQAHSACINAGYSPYNDQPIDLAGSIRIKDSLIDIGAYEYGCFTTKFLKDSICMGYIYHSRDFYYVPEKIGSVWLSQHLFTDNQCDSLVYLELYVLSSDTTYLEETLCLGNPYINHGFDTLPPKAGIIMLHRTHTNSYGCDSTIALTLCVIPPDTTRFEHELCVGDTFNQHGFDIHSDSLGYGDFFFTLSSNNVHGCDSIVQLSLKVHPVHDTILYDEVVIGEIYKKNEFLVYTDTLSPGVLQLHRTVQNQYGCDSVIHLHLQVKVGVNDFIEDHHVLLFPNPTQDVINIHVLTNSILPVRMIVCDISGKILKDEILYQPTSSIDLSNIAKGMYFLTIKTEQKIIRTMKLTKQ